MPNEIYHKSNWGNANAEGFGDVYFDAAATNKLYNHSDYYENSWGTDKILRDLSNKASIVLTPTAYSDGSLNTVIPPYGFGPELVTNGDFDTDSDWIKDTGWSISGGFATRTNTGSFGALYQNCLISGKKYEVTITISSITSQGFFGVRLGINYILQGITEAGTYTGIGTSTSATLSVMGNQTFAGSIDSISIKEVQEADFDFSRGSSATRVNEQGLIESIASGLPRIDYTSGFGSLLLEPQSTNLITYSEDLTQGSTNRLLLTSNVDISPDGTQNAYKLIPNNTSSSYHYFAFSGLTIATNNVYSVFLKKSEYQYALISFEINGVSGSADKALINLNNGVIEQSDTETTVTHYGNGWYRCSIKATSSRTSVAIYPLPSTSLTSFAGDNTSGIFAWGLQSEALSYATSYIPTSGSTVTRSADVANNSGNADLFNDSEGVLYAEIAKDTTSVDGGVAISDSSYTNRVLFYFDTSGNIRAYVYSSGVQANIITSGLDYTDNNKLALKYSATSTKFFVNGFQVGSTDTSSTMPVGLSELAFDDGGGGSDFYGKAKELAVFKEALTDAELENLTSWVSFTEMATDLEYTLE